MKRNATFLFDDVIGWFRDSNMGNMFHGIHHAWLSMEERREKYRGERKWESVSFFCCPKLIADDQKVRDAGLYDIGCGWASLLELGLVLV